MIMPHFSTSYENWAPTVARVVFGLIFLMSAYYKIPGTEMFNMQVGQSAAAGIPFPLVAVFLAFILELVAGVALVIGWHTRTAAFLLAGFVVLVALFFYRNLSDMTTFALFMSCVNLVAGLVYVSVYGAHNAAMKKDTLPVNV